MLSVEEARDRLGRDLRPTDGETVALADADGRVPVSFDVVAGSDVPPFANSAMDGFAVRAADGLDGRRVVGESRAGGPPAPAVEGGTAVRVMTGAPMPDGADTVVPIEEADEEGGQVRVRVAPAEAAHVRPAALDVARGQSIELPAAPFGPSVIGLLAALGVASVEVRRRPRVAILSTGDELRPVGEPLAPGQIHDANAPALAAAVREAGGEAVVLERAPDDPGEIERRVREASASADLLVASGGVSVGAHDHVRGVIERLGSLDFWRIAVQPGKPLAFGRVGDVPVVGLPGNPVSALVTFEIFVRPMIRATLRLPGDGRQHVQARIGERIGKDTPRRAYLRAVVARDGGDYVARSAGGQGSSQLLPLASANALLVVPEGVEATEPGGCYEAILLGEVA